MFMICLCDKDSLVPLLELLDPEDEGIMFFRNVRNYLQINTA
jgi:hypothetical protein